MPASLIHATRASGEWVFVDIGFSSTTKSCGIAVGDARPREVKFGDLAGLILDVARAGSEPMNLLIEAPLSVAFNAAGNPTGRAIERCGTKTRYWYVGSGCAVLMATTFLIRELYEAAIRREIRLFEGFATFKTKPVSSSHIDDVSALRNVVWNRGDLSGMVIGPEVLKANPDDTLISAFAVSGMDLDVPPVVLVGNEN